MKRREDGRYCKQILVGYKPDGTKKMKTVYGKTIKEVEHNEVYRQIELGVNVSEKLTVAQWADIWLKTFKIDVANNTYERYAGIVRNQINPTLGEILLTNVKLNILQKLINDMSDKYAPATVKKTKDVLHQIFKQAVRSQYIPINPAENIVTPKFYQQDRETIPAEHIKNIVEFCKDYKHGAFIMTLLYTGLRRGEIMALMVQNILGHSSINVTLEIYTHLSRYKNKINVDKMNTYIENQITVSLT